MAKKKKAQKEKAAASEVKTNSTTIEKNSKAKSEAKNNADPSSQKQTPKSEEKSSKNDMTVNLAIIVLIAILLLTGIGFLGYGIYRSIEERNGDQEDTQQDAAADSSNNEEEGEDSNNDQKGEIDQDGSESSARENGTTPGVSTQTANQIVNKYPRTDTNLRRGNNYSFGDIEGNSYTVRSGDTLWQIAEARYGSGYAWVDINRANGGFSNLPSGEPVLLPVGYQLVLPDSV